MRIGWFCMIFLMVAMAHHPARAQDRPEFEETTSTTDRHAPRAKDPTRERTIWKLYRYSTQGILPGNACFEETTRKMGFEYVVIPEEGPGSLTHWEVFKNNLGIGFLLCFRAGPWYPIVLAVKRKECRIKMGDYVG